MKLKSRIERLVKELSLTEYFETHFVKALEECLSEISPRKFNQIVCYGLGSFCDSVDTTSRYQLALLILIHSYLLDRGHPLCEQIEIFDPSFQDIDKETLSSLSRPQFTLIEENEFCARRLSDSERVNSCVLFYMPHLDKYLYNNLVGVNWDRSCLSRLVILGNSFQEMIDNEPSSKASSELHYLNVLVNNFDNTIGNKKLRRKPSVSIKSGNKEKALIESSIRGESFKHPDVFNSLSFHMMNNKWFVENSNKIELQQKPNWVCRTYVPTDEWDE